MLHSRASVLGLATLADVADDAPKTPIMAVVALISKPQTWALVISAGLVWFLATQVSKHEADMEAKIDQHIAATTTAEKLHDQLLWQICVGVNPKNPGACPFPPRGDK